eukprot:CAMPEP_0171183324 /NCGR_PEP_ID=MMETSP0790-20130122/15221_1 /TAXON_ID=2925 /ORGANISM="Alexandrium catenella, Strain OF101" /LENGTH=432 /DNA_ID=CAMNT_0011648299 /DNA_START=60 /DNA_END=1358 /DNA_ORIENTATION=+
MTYSIRRGAVLLSVAAAWAHWAEEEASLVQLYKQVDGDTRDAYDAGELSPDRNSSRLRLARLLRFSSWVTGPFGACSKVCQQKSRKVSCHLVLDGTALSTHLCDDALRPAEHRACNCELEECVDSDKVCGREVEPEHDLSSAADHFQNIGCYKLVQGDQASCPEDEFFDSSCMAWSQESPCRSGLAFFRNCSASTPQECSAFCARKGLDVSAVVEEKECRCGATMLNGQVWRGNLPRPGIAFRSELEEAGAGTCPLAVRRFAEPYESGGPPLRYRMKNLVDQAYADSIVMGWTITPEDKLWLGSRAHRLASELPEKAASSTAGTPPAPAPPAPASLGRAAMAAAVSAHLAPLENGPTDTKVGTPSLANPATAPAASAIAPAPAPRVHRFAHWLRWPPWKRWGQRLLWRRPPGASGDSNCSNRTGGNDIPSAL